jgi:hypothetical protein
MSIFLRKIEAVFAVPFCMFSENAGDQERPGKTGKNRV